MLSILVENKPRFLAFNDSISPCNPANMSWCWSCKNRIFCSSRTCSGVLLSWSSLFCTSWSLGLRTSLLHEPLLVLFTCLKITIHKSCWLSSICLLNIKSMCVCVYCGGQLTWPKGVTGSFTITFEAIFTLIRLKRRSALVSVMVLDRNRRKWVTLITRTLKIHSIFRGNYVLIRNALAYFRLAFKTVYCDNINPWKVVKGHAITEQERESTKGECFPGCCATLKKKNTHKTTYNTKKGNFELATRGDFVLEEKPTALTHSCDSVLFYWLKTFSTHARWSFADWDWLGSAREKFNLPPCIKPTQKL